MAAPIRSTEIHWLDPVEIKFGFVGLSERHAQAIMRDIINDGWPVSRRPKQCVYVIRLSGVVAVDYPNGTSPVVYIGEGNAYSRAYGHTNWLTPLVLSIPQVGIEVRVAEVARRNHATLYQYIEADMIRWFGEEFGVIPWFNQQRERSKEQHYEYDDEAMQTLKKALTPGSGNRFLWAIKPTKINDLFTPYEKGRFAQTGD